MPDFPSELVEAAAKALYEHFAFPHHGAIEQPWEEQTDDARETWYGQARAVLPLIEQRVIDRLAREAGSNPYTPAPAARHYDAQSDDVIRESAWDEGAACGVAAERARWERLAQRAVEALRAHQSAWITVDDRLSDPYPDDPRWTPWTRFGAPACRRGSDVKRDLLAALAPERTGEGA